MVDYNTNKEVWKPVKGYEGYYIVSNKGNVKSLDRHLEIKRGDRVYKRKMTGRLLVKTKHDQYESVKLSVNCKEKTFKVHRLVADAFIPNVEKLPEINHKDENGRNNDINNLEWCDRSYNNNYGTRIKRIHSHPNTIKAIKRLGKKRRRRVKGINRETGDVVFYDSLLSAEKDGFDNGHISKCCKGQRKSHKGYIWKYV